MEWYKVYTRGSIKDVHESIQGLLASDDWNRWTESNDAKRSVQLVEIAVRIHMILVPIMQEFKI